MTIRRLDALLALALAASAAPAFARPAPTSGYFTTRDGTSLAVIVSLPSEAIPPGGWPVLFTYDGYAAGTEEDTPYADRFVPAA